MKSMTLVGLGVVSCSLLAMPLPAQVPTHTRTNITFEKQQSQMFTQTTGKVVKLAPACGECKWPLTFHLMTGGRTRVYAFPGTNLDDLRAVHATLLTAINSNQLNITVFVVNPEMAGTGVEHVVGSQANLLTEGTDDNPIIVYWVRIERE